MALRFAYGVLLFCLLLLRCDHISGARDVAKDSYKSAYGTKENLEDQSGYASGYAAAYRTQKDAKDSYESAYGTKENLEDQSGYSSGYAAAYRTQKDTKDSYESAYGTKENLEDQSGYATGYAATYRTQKVAKDSHKSAYSSKKNLEDQSGYASGYAAAYQTQKVSKDSYESAYGSKENLKDQSGYASGYAAAYRTKKVAKDTNYITAYGTKDLDAKYAEMEDVPEDQTHANGGKDVDEQHLKQEEVANQKEMNQPYIAGYTSRRANYITAYRTRQDGEESYLAKYGTKEDLEDSGMKNKKQIDNDVKDVADQNLQKVEVTQEKGMNQPYKAGYRNRQYEAGYGNRQYDAGYRNRQYEAGYRTRQDAKDNYIAGYTGKRDQGPYTAGYRSAQDVKELDYISAYGDGKDSKESGMEHENHMAAKPSSHMDRSEAFKSGFFTMDDLFVGKTMPLRFPIQEFPHFLPREEADSIPFSMAQLSNVLQLYSIPPGSPSARAMENTLQQCESLPIKGEIKHCATSLESMLGFVHNIMGSWPNLDVLTITHPTVATVSTQNYSVLRISEEIYAPKWVACHPLPYPYKVFYCHFIERSKIFKVLLGGENEHKVEAVAVCHMDTSEWDPDHILFRQLGIKPGSSSPICHFLPVYHLVWVPSPTPATASI
ncbi:BURP domain-containing protein 9-like isoform X2 [Carya illinoinensis]|uniref:BURP domain-containing protein 9-like isoform X2 n=1 Tax=Carya illinoinensis TaxID=32201 RepID=UPI001C72681E|nr:BURP domain-containing protein 9-like isoform X2 [Carya illinoinensis]